MTYPSGRKDFRALVSRLRVTCPATSRRSAGGRVPATHPPTRYDSATPRRIGELVLENRAGEFGRCHRMPRRVRVSRLTSTPVPSSPPEVATWLDFPRKLPGKIVVRNVEITFARNIYTFAGISTHYREIIAQHFAYRVYTRGEKTAEFSASIVVHRHDHISRERERESLIFNRLTAVSTTSACRSIYPYLVWKTRASILQAADTVVVFLFSFSFFSKREILSGFTWSAARKHSPRHSCRRSATYWRIME